MELEPKILDLGSKKFKRIKKVRDFLLDSVPEIDLERAKIYTEVYDKNSSKPTIVIRALALKELLSSKEIKIYDNELIVGNITSSPRSAYIFPEYAIDYILKELDGDPYHFNSRPGDIFEISEEDTKELKELCRDWKGKTSTDSILELMPDDTKKYMKQG